VGAGEEPGEGELGAFRAAAAGGGDNEAADLAGGGTDQPKIGGGVPVAVPAERQADLPGGTEGWGFRGGSFRRREGIGRDCAGGGGLGIREAGMPAGEEGEGDADRAGLGEAIGLGVGGGEDVGEIVEDALEDGSQGSRGEGSWDSG